MPGNIAPPPFVKVGPFDYVVIEDHAELADIGHARHSTLLGHANHTELTLHLEPSMADGAKRDTLLHEVLHAITTVTDVVTKVGVDVDEDIISRITPALLGVLRDNPALVAYLTEGAD